MHEVNAVIQVNDGNAGNDSFDGNKANEVNAASAVTDWNEVCAVVKISHDVTHLPRMRITNC